MTFSCTYAHNPIFVVVVSNFVLFLSLAVYASPAAVEHLQKDYEYHQVTKETREKANTIISTAMSSARIGETYNTLARFVDDFGPRFSGTPALEAALDWVVATAANEKGYKVTTEAVLVPTWVRGTEWGTLHTPTRNKTLHFVGIGMSNGTEGKVVTATLLVVTSD